MLEDEWLKWQFRRGSRAALARIYEKYLDSLLTLAMGLLNDASEAQDVVHDVFVSFAKSAPGFGLRGSLSGYLATSVVNRVRDHRRRLRRQAGGSCRVGLAPPADTNDKNWWGKPHPTAAPEVMVIFNEEAARLNAAVAQLPDEQREVVVLRLTADMKFQDIAKLQQASISTVQGRYRYGLSRLRTLLNGEVET